MGLVVMGLKRVLVMEISFSVFWAEKLGFLSAETVWAITFASVVRFQPMIPFRKQEDEIYAYYWYAVTENAEA